MTAYDDIEYSQQDAPRKQGELHPRGSCKAICVDVIDLGEQENTFKKGPDGEFYEFAQFTGLFYGDERANLTSLLDFMLPDVPHEEKRKGVDVEQLVGQRFRGRIAYAPNKKGDLRPRLSFLEPVAEPPL